MLCLCPNDRVRFGYGAIVITDELEVLEAVTQVVLGKLNTVPGHKVSPEFLAYHRTRFAY
jgi:putative restriction endonuclease